MIKLVPVSISPEYAKKWNEHCSDFVNIYKDGVKISDTLYRVGGIGGSFKDGYIMLLKYIEAFYSKDIMKMCGKDAPKNNRHLDGNWCILNEDGEEKVNFFKSIDSAYLQGGVIYSNKGKYYNIETGELYCYANTSMSTENYLFLHNGYDNDKSKRGVLKIDKKTGEFELIN